jgi:hypothetical protein
MNKSTDHQIDKSLREFQNLSICRFRQAGFFNQQINRSSDQQISSIGGAASSVMDEEAAPAASA